MKFEIMVSILLELLAKKCVKASYLAEKYEVSVRSIYRYINSLELAGVPIYTVRGNNGGFSIVDTYKLSSTYFSEKEYSQIISTLEAINNGVESKFISSVITKLKAVSKHEFNAINLKSGNLVIDGGPWGDAVGYKTKLKVIQQCIEDNLQLLIKYHDRNGSITERLIDPHVLVFKQGLWYVYAYCNLRNEFRFFKTGRIESATIQKTKFLRKEINNEKMPLDFWNNSFDTIDVVMEISKNVLSDVEEWLGIENVSVIKNKHVASCKLPYDDGLVSKIMSYGNGIKVLEPQNLKERIKQSALDIIQNY